MADAQLGPDGPRALPALLRRIGSAAGAIRQAGEMLSGGSALVVHVWLPPSVLLLQGRRISGGHPLAEAIEEFDASAREAAEQLAADGVRIATEAEFEAKPVTIEARHGVWRPIVEFAEKCDAHAVVVGSQGLSPVTSALLGSVSHGIVTHCTRSMVVVPSKGK